MTRTSKRNQLAWTFTLGLIAASGPVEAGEPALFGLTGGGDLVSINLTTGAGNFVGSTGLLTNAAASDSLNRLHTIDQDQIFDINIATGEATLVKDLTGRPIGYVVRGMAFDADDELYVVLTRPAFDDLLARIDLDTGQYNVIGPLGIGGTDGLAFDPFGTLYGTNSLNDLVIVNKVTAAATMIGGVGIEADDDALEFDRATGRCFAAHDNLIEIDPQTGTATLIGPIGIADIRRHPGGRAGGREWSMS